MTHLTIARRDDRYGIYRQQADGTHRLVHSGSATHTDPAVFARAVADEGTEIADVTAEHLCIGGTWIETVETMTEPAGRERLIAAIADLEAQATARRQDAAFAGEMSDRGASRLTERAAGMRDAFTILTGEALPATLKPRF